MNFILIKLEKKRKKKVIADKKKVSVDLPICSGAITISKVYFD